MYFYFSVVVLLHRYNKYTVLLHYFLSSIVPLHFCDTGHSQSQLHTRPEGRDRFCLTYILYNASSCALVFSDPQPEADGCDPVHFFTLLPLVSLYILLRTRQLQSL